MKSVLIGMSGGVDSTLAALRLREDGYSVYGVVLRMHDHTEVEEAEEAANALGIPLSVVDCSARFRDCVIADFLKEYQKGRTPNPCIVCNETVKFRALYEEARRLEIPYIATGHYAKVAAVNGRYAVCRAADSRKDQSYMLYRLSQDILSALLLPLGDSIKTEIVDEARRLRLTVAERAESQELCFVKGESYADYIDRIYGEAPEGDFVDEEGRVLGRHKGVVHYTVGQRKGLGISAAGRLFVKEINVSEHKIVLSDSKVLKRELLLTSPVFSGIAPEDLEKEEDLYVKLRYTATPVKASAHFAEEGIVVTMWRISLMRASLSEVRLSSGFISSRRPRP
ncbi:MAG: tRNA 2-thiouridine(34) synthase MnmA, partial [Clostridia bacterium]|nr:tRNA 2-thiouridine(34) synthase MnmA [Clostridia bacterium]